MLANNRISRISKDFAAVCPRLDTMILSGNRLQSLADLDNLPKQLKRLVCLDNVVCSLQVSAVENARLSKGNQTGKRTSLGTFQQLRKPGQSISGRQISIESRSEWGLRESAGHVAVKRAISWARSPARASWHFGENSTNRKKDQVDQRKQPRLVKLSSN